MSHRFYNALQTVVLLGAMAALAGYLGWVLFGMEGLIGAAIVVPLVAALTPGASPRLVLRFSGATEIAPAHAPGLYRLHLALAQRAGLGHAPRLYYVPTRVLNAFAVGQREEAAIALTDGLLRSLTSRELTGVLAHELAHVRSNDVWVMTLADVVGRVTGMLSFFGVLLLAFMLPFVAAAGMRVPVVPLLVLMLAPFASALLQLALSRTREYDADIAAAQLTGDPRGLAQALDKLERLQGGWMERMFMSRTPRWLRTHPDIGERIRRLIALERSFAPPLSYADYADDPLFGRPPIVRRPRWHWHGLWY